MVRARAARVRSRLRLRQFQVAPSVVAIGVSLVRPIGRLGGLTDAAGHSIRPTDKRVEPPQEIRAARKPAVWPSGVLG